MPNTMLATTRMPGKSLAHCFSASASLMTIGLDTGIELDPEVVDASDMTKQKNLPRPLELGHELD